MENAVAHEMVDIIAKQLELRTDMTNMEATLMAMYIVKALRLAGY